MPYLWYSVLEFVSFFALPVLLFVQIYILYCEFPGFLQKVGLGKKEVGLLIVGSLIGWVSDVPIIIYGNSLLAINISGGIIPIVLSVYFARKKELNPWLVAVGTGIIALISYKVTYIMEGVGIVSEFPYYLLPASAAALVALVSYRGDVTKSAPFAYILATMGTMIGADIVRIPELFKGKNFIGSIGGAGVLDMVFTSGLLAMGICFLFAIGKLSTYKREKLELKLMEEEIEECIESSNRAFEEKNMAAAAERNYMAVQRKIKLVGKKFGIEGKEEFVLRKLGLDAAKIRDFIHLREELQEKGMNVYRANRAFVAGTLLFEELKRIERKAYASGLRRTAAFLIDFAIILVIVLIGFMVLLASLSVSSPTDMIDMLSEGSVWFVAFILWTWAFQMLYFTILEFALKGQSIGKRVMGIRVVTVEQRRASFMHIFTRNVVRFLDLILIFYLISFLAVELTDRGQRIGDYVADTVVIRESGS